MQTQAAAGAYPRHLNRQIHGLRGFSALAVFVFHVYGMGTLWDFWPAALNPAAPFFIAGRHGVEIFFIISGYLITGSLIRHQSAIRFLIDRVIRIYPVFMTIQIIVFGMGPFVHYRWLAEIGPAAWAKTFIENGLFLPGIFKLPLAQQNAWSLSYEAAFYLVSAACFLAWQRVGRWPVIVMLAIFLGFAFHIDARAAFFLPGVAVFFLSRWRGIELPGWFRLLSLPALAITLGMLEVSESAGSEFVFAAMVPALIFFICLVEGACPLSALLRIPALQFLGTISYSFYLWSPVVTYPMKLIIQRYLHGHVSDMVNIGLFATIGFTASVAVAYCSYRFLEDKAARKMHRGAAFARRRSALRDA